MRRAARRAGAALLATLLAGCSGHYRPVSDGPVRLGRPYVVRGVTYTPAADPSYDMLGYASWYGSESGNRTALGERFRAKWVTAAHPTLPLPSYVEVTAIDTGRVILLRVNDRGPFARDRLIDLSRGAAELLGVRASGHVAVRVRVVEPPERDRERLRRGKAAAQRPDVSPEVAANLRAQLDAGLRAIGR
ncbi:septal ring lytic transglycosylase RlpA family protein [Sphingomonas yunnanensis]|uniref:septal ring lytic transglycosylase RlpA family protein n=1 Tax=Sphingomonas yunnanensis TaxID=310400 RepID=UPI001CA7A7EF|nr:septal ring lytic transglycosylase RlpA family protein [Sphingomonas yunnanensis]MBY9063728.1 septal ring lytic transglycosylase RlpA family protein [Sphingomonas yunnanensis]